MFIANNGVYYCTHDVVLRMEVVLHRYASNNAPAIELVSDIGELIANVTVNLPEFYERLRRHYGKGVVFVREYQNPDLWDAVVASGLIIDLGLTVPCGYGRAHVGLMRDE